MESREVVIIGGGPSGFTAALYLARATLKPLVLAGEKKGGQLMFTTEVENYPGFPEGVMGPDLMVRMEEQAKKFGAEIRQVNATKVEFINGVKKIWVGDELIETKAVVISTGASSRMLGLGEEKLLGRGVSTCAVCDAAFFKDKKTVVLGGGDAAMEDALALSKFASEVTMIHRRDEFRASKIMQDKVLSNPKIKVIWSTEIVGVKGGGKLEGIRIKNSTGEESDLQIDGLFLAIGHLPETSLFKDQVELDEKGYLTTTMTAMMQSNKWRVSDKDIWRDGYPTMTSRAGVFGCGDVVDYRYKQAVTAAGMGCQAALDVEKYLTGNVSSW
ncbi:MAG: Thioredoxin reductase [Candidatus Collierbacteria bacterium GW2011_GWA1_44_12]|uniref:Thioredoxin reductase n=2 Tax=Candidatus Collieribacteriota TaxID=1752725 RepID=A0A0G1JI48_9BACT|nr:MAG: Thioredoxin reductase [Candidatus Collierbacteria bacterium GW2011_GWA1_44_12]